MTVRLFFAAILCALCALPTTIFAQNVFPPAAKLEKLWDKGTHTEGVAVAPDGAVYFCDNKPTDQPGALSTGSILRWDDRARQAVVVRASANQANGMKFDQMGRMLIAEGADNGGRRIVRIDLTTGASEILAGRYREKLLNSPNDLIVAADNRIYFTDPRYDGREPIEQPVQGVYLIDTDNSIKLIAADAKPNGLAISPDGKTLYVANHDNGAFDTSDLPPDAPLRREMQIRAYDLKPDGKAVFRRVLVDYAQAEGADGLTVDRAGNIYAAVRDLARKGVRVYSPTGAEIAFLPTPEVPANIAFGRGGDSQTLYIAAGGSLYRVKTAATGFQPVAP